MNLKYRSRILTAALAAVLCLAAVAPAEALVAPSATVFTVPAVKSSYVAVTTGLAPAGSATDFFTLTGSATKLIRVTHAECSGTSTAAATAVVVALKRSTANSAGTSVNLSEIALDSTQAAASATALAYTANPTTGTLVGNIGAGVLSTNTAATSAFAGKALTFDFGTGQNSSPVVLRGIAQVFALNGAGASFTSGASLVCSVSWTEE